LVLIHRPLLVARTPASPPFLSRLPPPPTSPLFPYTTLFRSGPERRKDDPPLRCAGGLAQREQPAVPVARRGGARDAVSRVVAVTARRSRDEGVERAALNVAYVRALADAALAPVIVPPPLAPEAAGPLLGAVAG